jgi:hypothetical protein
MLEGGLTGAQDFKLVMECNVVQLFPHQQSLLPLQQRPFQLLHITRPLVDLAHIHGKVLLLLDDDVSPGLG